MNIVRAQASKEGFDNLIMIIGLQLFCMQLSANSSNVITVL